jgi:predicted anti-sigma-YlaC factor YlaD
MGRAVKGESDIMDHEMLKKLVSSYLDGELGQEERRIVASHLEECSECRQAYREMSELGEVMAKVTIKEPPKEVWKMYTESVYNRLERGIGWILVSIGAMILLFFAGYQMLKGIIMDPSMPLIVKGGILCGTGGVVVLLVSLIRERLFVNKRERYKEIEK